MPREGTNWCITPHVLYELCRGVAGAPDARGEIREIEKLGERCRFLPFDRDTAREAGRMAVFLEREGDQIPDRDLFIAASTILYGDCMIVTRDREHFGRLRQFGLIVIDQSGLPDWS